MSQAGMWLDQIVAGTAQPPPMVHALRMPPIEGWAPGSVWGHWDVDPDMHHAGGATFGGYIAALADSFLGLAMLSTMADGELFTTSDLRVSFFRPVIKGRLSIVAEVINRSRRLGHVEAVMVNDADDKVVAKSTATQVVIPPPVFTKEG